MNDTLHSIVKDLPPGTYHIKYVLEGHEDIVFDIIVVAGQPKTHHKSFVILIPEGKTDLEKSEIPDTIYLETKAPFAIYTENTGVVSAKYLIHLKFTGIDVSKSYEFDSDWGEEIKPGDRTRIIIDVVIPSDAIPKGQMNASYDISTTVEAV